MATDIKISELNEITVNNDLNQIIVNNRENSGDSGITKKIQISNLLTPNIVKTSNITDCAVTTNKIDNSAITCDKIAGNTITSDQVTCCGISNGSLATNSVDNRVINNSDNFTFNCVTAATNVNTPLATVTDKLTVGALGCGKTVSLNGINYDFPATETPNYFLQTDGSGNLDWAEAVPGDGTALAFSDIVPVGTIIPWAGAALPADGKWLECNGTTFDGTGFPELSAVLGDTWGTHSGSNYYLPNLQGRAAVGAGTGNDGTDSCAFALGTSGGEYNHQLTCDEMPNHCHNLNGYNLSYNNNWPHGATSNLLPWYNWSGAHNKVNYNSTADTGGNQSHNNIQPYAVTRYIIKAKPDDIQQFDMNVGPGLSALNASGGQTASIDLSSSEIGLKVSNDFQFDGSGRLDLSAPVTNSLSRNIVQEINRYRYSFYGRNNAGWTPIYTGPASGGSQPEMSVTITPKFSTSKLLVSFIVHAGGDSHSPAIKLFKNGAEIPELIPSNPESASRFKDATATGSFQQYYTSGGISFKFLDDNGGSGFTAGVPVVYSLKQSAYYSGYLYTINGGRGNYPWTISVVSSIEAEEIYQ